jgi:hypothetical protein
LRSVPDTSRQHEPRGKAKGNENPFKFGGTNKKAPAKANLAPTSKLEAVKPQQFYGNSTRAMESARLASSAQHAAQSSRNDKGKNREIVDVDETDEDSIEDAQDFEQTPARASAQRPSMTRGKEMHHARDEDGDELVLLETQTAAGNQTKGMAKQKKTGGKGVPVSNVAREP